jgi:hypothetical protein
MCPVPLESNIILLVSSEALDGAVLLRHLDCSQFAPETCRLRGNYLSKIDFVNGVRESFAGPLVKSTYVKLTENALTGQVEFNCFPRSLVGGSVVLVR